MNIDDFIDADDPIVADLLAGTIELIADAGGWIAPSTTFVCRDGQLHVESNQKDGQSLLHIPREVCVRVDHVSWSDNSDRLEILEINQELGELELEMLYLQIALHNQCDKLTWTSRTHPWLAPDLPEVVTHAVRQLLPTFRETAMSAADVLWANRCFKIAYNENEPPQRLLIPLVDLLNHHARGATGNWTTEAFEASTNKAFGTNECALNYGMNRDPLEMAAVYGFVDESGSAIQTSDRDALIGSALENLVEIAAQFKQIEACKILQKAAAESLTRRVN